MEQQSGPCGWGRLGNTPKPGQLRLWTFQSVAHGAEAILYFRWRACAFGAEEYWYGILDHDGIPRRRYYEVQQTGAELASLSDWTTGSKVLSEAALIKSYDNLWSHGNQKHNANFDYNSLLQSYYNALAANTIGTDVTGAEADLSAYKLIMMPAFNLMKEEIRARLDQYVRQGGALVITFRSGTRTWNNSMSTETLPGGFREMAGVEVEEFDSLNHGRQVGVSTDSGLGTATVWCDVLHPITAGVIASYTEEYYRGKPAATVNAYGKGKVYYIGCDLDQACLNSLVGLIASNAGLSPAFAQLPDGMEAVKKEKDGKPYYIILNHDDKPGWIALDGNYTDLLTNERVNGSIALDPYGVLALTPES